VVFFFILFQFSDKIFVNNGLDKKHVCCLNERLFRPKKYPAVFDDVRKYATKRDYYPPSRLLIISLLSRNLADDNFYVRALFATLKFQLGSINELTAAERRTYDLHRGLVILFPHRGDLKIIASSCLSISYSLSFLLRWRLDVSINFYGVLIEVLLTASMIDIENLII